jgi:hypothetical protein
MNFRLFLIADALILFLGYTLWVIATVGYVGFFQQALSTPVGIQLVIDVVLSLSLALVWMRGDARNSGVPFAPYLIVTLVLGSAGPLGYLLHRELRERRSVAARVVAA